MVPSIRILRTDNKIVIIIKNAGKIEKKNRVRVQKRSTLQRNCRRPFVLDMTSAVSWLTIQYIVPVRTRQRVRGFSSLIDNRMSVSEDKHRRDKFEFHLGKSRS
jgi:hypothetical protein